MRSLFGMVEDASVDARPGRFLRVRSAVPAHVLEPPLLLVLPGAEHKVAARVERMVRCLEDESSVS